MSENKKPEEEVEIGQLFIVIGNAINTFVKKIGDFFKILFHYFILSILFIKKNIIILAISSVLAGLIGYLTSVKNNETYYSEMILDTNYNSGTELYKQTEFLNKLIKNRDFKNLSEILRIDESSAKSISNLEVEPYKPEQNILKEYDNFIKDNDTIFTKNITINDFKERYNNQDYRFQKLTANGSDKNVFINLNNKILNLVENDYYKNLLDTKNKEFENRKKILLKNLYYIDSLRKAYKEIDLLNAKKSNTNPTNNINLVDKPSDKNRDIELFNQSNSILTKLKLLDNEILRNGYIIKTVSKFNLGEKSIKIKDKPWFKFSLLGFLSTLLILVFLKINNYLNNYTA
ncbi:MAG TPA: hypothetical protein ENK67_01135 [Flavobacteriia bacterium]|nr:hypothetical protein [Flavobacteriia bacterium]